MGGPRGNGLSPPGACPDFALYFPRAFWYNIEYDLAAFPLGGAARLWSILPGRSFPAFPKGAFPMNSYVMLAIVAAVGLSLLMQLFLSLRPGRGWGW